MKENLHLTKKTSDIKTGEKRLSSLYKRENSLGFLDFVQKALLIIIGIFVLSGACTPTSIVTPVETTDFTGTLSYSATEYVLLVNDDATSSGEPDGNLAAAEDVVISYSLETIEGVDFIPAEVTDSEGVTINVVSIDKDTGEISIDPRTTNAGTVKYQVTASAEGYTPQTVELTITINLRVSGPPTGLAISTSADNSSTLTVQWEAPAETGMKTDTTPLETNDLQYRVYYVAETTTGQEVPTAATVKNDAEAASQVTMVTDGVVVVQLSELVTDTRYFVAVETYNSFTKVSTLSDTVREGTPGVPLVDFTGDLSYSATEYVLLVNDDATSSGEPNGNLAAAQGVVISYSLETIEGDDFTGVTGSEGVTIDVVDIDKDTGVISIDPRTTNTGTVTYRVTASAAGYNPKTVELTITINLRVSGPPTSLAISTSADNSSTLIVEWVAPEETGMKTDTTPLETDELEYRVYYVAETTAGQDAPDAATVKNDAEAASQVTTVTDGSTRIEIPSLTEGTRYFVAVETYNSFTGVSTLSDTVREETIARPASVVLQVMSMYYSSSTMEIPVVLGQAVRDPVLEDNQIVFAIGGSLEGDYSIHVGSTDSTSFNTTSLTKSASDGVVELSKADLDTIESSSFVDGMTIGIDGYGIEAVTHVATYRPSEIHGWQDLQAIRVNTTGNYALKRDIVFPSDSNTYVYQPPSLSSSEMPSGTTSGSIDGAKEGGRYSISNLQIDSEDSSRQGLFATIEGLSPATVVASNLILRDFNIKGMAFVGALAGEITRGTVKSVSVEVVDGSQIEVTGQESNEGNGGGLVGVLGSYNRTSSDQVSRAFVMNSDSAAMVMGSSIVSTNIGGLVGVLRNGVVKESYATGIIGNVESSASYVGGLVGYNVDGIISGYATGNVQSGGNAVGGLVGGSTNSEIITSRGVSITGYATGNVRGTNGEVGGLVGKSTSVASTTAGTETIINGYALGKVTGPYRVGGLVGYSERTNIFGYARGNVVRNNSLNSSLLLGSVIGELGVQTMNTIYHSSLADESIVYGYDEIIVLDSDDLSGIGGNPITIATATQVELSGLRFGTDEASWTWVGDGKWPAINIGEVAPASEQPTD